MRNKKKKKNLITKILQFAFANFCSINDKIKSLILYTMSALALCLKSHQFAILCCVMLYDATLREAVSCLIHNKHVSSY